MEGKESHRTSELFITVFAHHHNDNCTCENFIPSQIYISPIFFNQHKVATIKKRTTRSFSIYNNANVMLDKSQHKTLESTLLVFLHVKSTKKKAKTNTSMVLNDIPFIQELF